MSRNRHLKATNRVASKHSAGIAKCGRMLKEVSLTHLHKVIGQMRLVMLVSILMSLCF